MPDTDTPLPVVFEVRQSISDADGPIYPVERVEGHYITFTAAGMYIWSPRPEPTEEELATAIFECVRGCYVYQRGFFPIERLPSVSVVSS